MFSVLNSFLAELSSSSFQANILFLYLLKTSQNQRYIDIEHRLEINESGNVILKSWKNYTINTKLSWNDSNIKLFCNHLELYVLYALELTRIILFSNTVWIRCNVCSCFSTCSIDCADHKPHWDSHWCYQYDQNISQTSSLQISRDWCLVWYYDYLNHGEFVKDHRQIVPLIFSELKWII